jgi:hypothetical protein
MSQYLLQLLLQYAHGLNLGHETVCLTELLSTIKQIHGCYFVFDSPSELPCSRLFWLSFCEPVQ